MNKIRVGTDCSGIEAPIVALKLLGISCDHIFSSDINEECRRVIQMNYSPKRIYKDITTRNHSSLPHVDLYVAGFPCQAFSGLRHDASGFKDPRGTIFFECLETIKHTKPKCFLLENVRGLLSHDSGNTFDTIIRSLNALNMYHISYAVLNTIDYNLPQNRPRVYIVGIHKRLKGSKCFKFPEPVPLTTKVSDLMDKHVKSDFTLTPNMKQVARERVSRKGGRMTDNYIVNVNGSISGFGSAMNNVSPCLLANAYNFYSTKYKRILTAREYLRLQGFPETFCPLPNETITKKQAGNSMSVNVLMAIFKKFLQFLQQSHSHSTRQTSSKQKVGRNRIE